MQITCQYEAYAGFHVLHLHTEGAPLLLFRAPSDVPKPSPRDLCEAGNLGNLEANVRVSYFDPAQDWPKPIEEHVSMAVVWEELAFLGDTRSRHELLVFAQAAQSRLPLAIGIV